MSQLISRLRVQMNRLNSKQKMKVVYIGVLICIFNCFSVFSQEVISTQGETYSNASANIDFTIGETVIHTVSDGSNELTQGFHQTTWIFLGIEDFSQEVQINLYPNPSVDVITIESSEYKEHLFEMFDSGGKLVLQGELVAEKTHIKGMDLAPGNYALTIRKEGRVLKTFKLLKSY
ncbi:MAG: hypothetical protein RIT43_1184 [Bacteroidota bacterium]